MRCHTVKWTICLLSCVILAHGSQKSLAGEISGHIGLENHVFFSGSQFPGQHSERINSSLVLHPEYYHRWDELEQSMTISPFIRLDAHDEERTHADIREFFWAKNADNWEISVGVQIVFWGVTESQHLIDVINQTDLVESIDGEEKLGQPMVHFTLFHGWGDLGFYVLPYFRERTFAGESGRLRHEFIVQDDQSTFDSRHEEHHVDWALRWFHVIGDFDIGLAHFQGTSREPRFLAGMSDGITVWVPHYDLIDQSSLDVQYTKNNWLWKLEALHRSGQGEAFNGFVGGFEYTVANIKQSGLDLGLLIEYNYDDRGADSLNLLQNDVFAGVRLTLNDTQNTEMLAGIIQDVDYGENIIFAEASRRVTDHIMFGFEMRAFSPEDENSPLRQWKADDYAQFGVFYYF